MENKLKKRRMELGFSQTRVSEITGIERTKYNRIENGTLKKVQLQDAYAIARALETDISKVFQINDLYIIDNEGSASLKSNSQTNMPIDANQITQISGGVGISDRIKREWEMAVNSQYNLALIIAELDNFKRFSETFGLLIGDKCLLEVNAILNSFIKPSGGFVERYQENKFLILLSNLKINEILMVTEEIKKKISNSALGVNIQLGVVFVVAHDNISLDNMLAVADRTLYLAKKEKKTKLFYVVFDEYLSILEY
ncbi:MAG: diguanylate cyclase [Syntrophomonadaceae bacterium]|nr:diguanylate cyclase [Syntrophomonadaceae bacterium]